MKYQKRILTYIDQEGLKIEKDGFLKMETPGKTKKVST